MLQYMLFSALEDLVVLGLLVLVFKLRPDLLGMVRSNVREFLNLDKDATYYKAKFEDLRKELAVLDNDLITSESDICGRLNNSDHSITLQGNHIFELKNKITVLYESLENGAKRTLKNENTTAALTARVATLEEKQKEQAQGTQAVVSAIVSLESSLYNRLGPTPKPAKVLKVVKPVKGKKK